MFDLNDIDLPIPKRRLQHGWACLTCLKVSLLCDSCACGSQAFIPYLDRRPLLLNKEAKNAIVDLIDQAASKVEALEIEEQLYYTGVYMPFLSGLLDQAQVAEERKLQSGSGYRNTDLSTAELILLFQGMKLPPTAV